MENESSPKQQAEETTPKTEESKGPAMDPVPPAEEPILLNKLFPKAKQDLDALFSEPNMKRLLKDVVRTRQKNERFLKRIHQGEIPPEEDEEPQGAP